VGWTEALDWCTMNRVVMLVGCINSFNKYSARCCCCCLMCVAILGPCALQGNGLQISSIKIHTIQTLTTYLLKPSKTKLSKCGYIC